MELQKIFILNLFSICYINTSNYYAIWKDVMMLSVFGGTGFIGGEFIKKHKDLCILIDRSSRKPLTKDVLYFISTTHNYYVFSDVHKDIDVNLNILVDVLSNLKKGDVFNFISSWFVYGETKLPACEGSCCNPKGFYSITKYAAEQLIRSYCETFGIHYRIIRLCNVYGVGDKKFSKKKNALQFLIDQMKKNEPIGLYHNGEFYRDYLHVSDVVDAIALIIKTGNLDEVYNIGSGEKVKFRDIIEIAKNELGSNSEISLMEPTDFHKVVQVKDFYMDISKIKRLGFKPKVSLVEGVKSLCQE